jgi:hypothetical protein
MIIANVRGNSPMSIGAPIVSYHLDVIKVLKRNPAVVLGIIALPAHIVLVHVRVFLVLLMIYNGFDFIGFRATL